MYVGIWTLDRETSLTSIFFGNGRKRLDRYFQRKNAAEKVYMILICRVSVLGSIKISKGVLLDQRRTSHRM